MIDIIKKIFGPISKHSNVIGSFQALLESSPPDEPKQTPALNLYSTFYKLVKCLNLDYDDTEILYMAKTIYRFRGTQKSVDELSRFLNIKITLEGYPSADLSTAVKIIVSADAYLDDTVLLINLLQIQIPDLLFISTAEYSIELQIIRLTNVVNTFETSVTLLNSFFYVGGVDDVSKNSIIFKYKIAS